MSQDQRPARLRAVAGTAAISSDSPPSASSAAESLTATKLDLAVDTAKSSMLPGFILYLLGCAAGGVALAALPHFVGMP